MDEKKIDEEYKARTSNVTRMLEEARIRGKQQVSAASMNEIQALLEITHLMQSQIDSCMECIVLLNKQINTLFELRKMKDV